MTSVTHRFCGEVPAAKTARLSALAGAAMLALVFTSASAAQQGAPSTPAPADTQQPAAAQQTAATPDQQQQPATGQVPDAAAAAPAQTPAASQPDQNTTAPATPAENAPAAATSAPAQSPAQPASGQSPSGEPAKSAPAASKSDSSDSSRAGGITEEELRHLLVGKSLYLRGGYLDNNLSFDENGHLSGHSPQGSYTLSGIQIEKVHLNKHKIELDGARYGLHFLGALPYEDPTKAVDRVKITPKKKFVKITIDRELVVTPKKKKDKNQGKHEKAAPGSAVMASQSGAKPAVQPASDAAAKPDQAAAGAEQAAVTPDQPASQAAGTASAPAQAAPASGTPAQEVASSAQPASESAEPSDEEQAKAEMASAPAEERPAAPGAVTTTTSPAHATKVLKDALDRIFAEGLDDRMKESMPDFWKLYYEAVAARTDYRPKDPGVMRQAAVDQKAKLVSTFQPESNDFAQDAGVAGMSLYHAVIGADGKPQDIAVARPIGFGLDENAVAAIRKATFEPAMKDGKPVPVMLDLVVQFHIYSKRTNVASKPDDPNKPQDSKLPGPYTLRDPPKAESN